MNVKLSMKLIIKNISLGTNDYRRGDEIRPVKTGKIYEASKERINHIGGSETHQYLSDV